MMREVPFPDLGLCKRRGLLKGDTVSLAAGTLCGADMWL